MGEQRRRAQFVSPLSLFRVFFSSRLVLSRFFLFFFAKREILLRLLTARISSLTVLRPISLFQIQIVSRNRRKERRKNDFSSLENFFCFPRSRHRLDIWFPQSTRRWSCRRMPRSSSVSPRICRVRRRNLSLPRCPSRKTMPLYYSPCP